MVLTFIRKLYLLILIIALWGSCTSSDNADHRSNRDRPNVIIVMADDMGYGDLKSFGGDGSIETPVIDSLTAGGLKFTDFHSNGVVCSPTRASLMTGLYPQEAGVEGVVTAANHRDTGMSPDKYTLAELFGEAGYTSGIFGKWHLGYQPEFGPIVQGFDYFRGFVSGNVDYRSHIDQEGYPDWWRQKELAPEEGYLTDLITDHGLSFLEKYQNERFFLYLAHGAPHYPYQGPDDPADRTAHGEFPVLGSRQDIKGAYVEMIESLDQNIGRVISFLREKELLDQTLILFLSDNGATGNVGSNHPFRGTKGQVYEGGHRVPAALYWHGVVEPGESDDLILTMDILPTLAEIINIDIESKTDVTGRSFAPLVNGSEGEYEWNERTVFWRFREGKAARKGDWKIVINEDSEELYNLSKGIDESKNVRENNQEIFSQLKDELESWERSLDDEIIY
ncbi:sulfatase-like hydrolase/transferase [Halalkalibaculum sp. DA384]|uniref:sulfatase-like hydrolase/transferase n=1 Tax=Halalkalibaculum sp. DA384 TaxID=3373606 RepID=UPI0037551930